MAGPTGPWMLLSRILFRGSFPVLGSWLLTLLGTPPGNTPGGTICRSPNVPSGYPLLLHYSACGFQLLPSPHAPSSLSSTQGDPGPCLAIPRSVGAWKLSPGSGPEDQWTHSAISRSVGAWTLSPGSGPEDRRTHRAIPRSVGAWTLPPGRGLEDQRTQRSFPSLRDYRLELLDVQSLKTGDCMYCVQTFNCFRPEGKSSSCFSVLARGKISSNVC